MRSASGAGRAVALAAIATVLAAVAALLVGRFPAFGVTPLSDLISDGMTRVVVFHLRAPRVVAALLLGATLGAAGHVFQTVFGNPLVEPGIVGVSQGAALGASAAIVALGGAAGGGALAAIGGGVAAMVATWGLAKRIRYGGWTLRLVLAGIAVSAFASAGVGAVKYVADPLDQLPAIVFWMLGGVSNVGWGRVLPIAASVAPLIAILTLYRWRVHALALGEPVAHALGVAVRRERALVLGLAAVATALVVSLAGVVTWVGLVVPHAARRLTDGDSRRSLPLSIWLGALFVLVADTLARTVRPGEIPLGVITALVGVPAFLALMVRRPAAMQAASTVAPVAPVAPGSGGLGATAGGAGGGDARGGGWGAPPPRAVSHLAAEQISFAWPAAAAAPRAPLLADVSLAVGRGECVALLGRNGAGKSTLLQLMLGWRTPTAGRITLDGEPLAAVARRARGQSLSFVPQAEPVAFGYSVVEYVLLGRAPWMAPLAAPRPHDVAVAIDALETVGLTAYARRAVTTLSGGELQLVLVARALAQGTPFLLLDEPTTHLDHVNRATLIETLGRHVDARGRSSAGAGGVLFATHDLALVDELATRAVLIADGRVVADDDPATVIGALRA